MAERAMVPPSVQQLQLQRNVVKKQFLFPGTALTLIQREEYSRNCKLNQSQSLNSCKLACSFRNLELHRLQESLTKCYCLGTLVNIDNATTSDWVPYVDQVLLMASIFLTYIAGVIPSGKPLADVCKSSLSDSTVPKNFSISGSATENDNEVNVQFAWDIVKLKLLDSLYAMKQAGHVGNEVSGIDKDDALRQSSLFALAELPRIRCLWASFQWLQKEADNISGPGSSNVDFSMVLPRIIQNSCKALCLAWLEEELRLKDNRAKKALLSDMIGKLNGNDNILEYIRNSGKENLYSELIGALRFGSAGISGCYDPNLFTQHGVSILEDLVITLADGVASMYLELISVDGSMSSEMDRLGLNLCTLSTRALQKLRNEVALHQWLHQNMESVVSMYEDRFELRTFQTQLVEEGSKREAENFGWWKKLSLGRSGTLSPSLSFVVISHTSISVKRTKELRGLTGWQYYFSLFLELSDIAMPLIRTFIAKVSDAISFFLVCLIGRSLGLIYTGIRQSLRWK